MNTTTQLAVATATNATTTTRSLSSPVVQTTPTPTAWTQATWTAVHVVGNDLSETERTVVKLQITDQVKRKFAESNQVVSVTVSFETKPRVVRRLLSVGTGIKTVVTANNTRGGKQPVYTADFVDNTLTSILTAIQMKVISSTTSVNVQVPRTEDTGADDSTILIGMGVIVGVAILICAACFVVYKMSTRTDLSGTKAR